MSQIDSATLSSLGLALPAQTASNKQSLGQDDFLRLLTTQLQNQDPFKPMENGEFMGQMAQFSTVSGIQDMSASMSSLVASLQSSQMLQAASLAGREVLVSGNAAVLGAEGDLRGALVVPQSGQVEVEILDASGAHVRTLDLGQLAAGTQSFSWDGLDDAQLRAAPGTYTLVARALDGDGSAQVLDTSVVATVAGVVPTASGVALEFDGLPPVALADVIRFM